MDTAKKNSFMANIRVFSQFSSEDRGIIAKLMEYEKIKKGDVLITEDSFGNSMYYVVSGMIEIQKKSEDGRHVFIAQISSGSMIGELAMVENDSYRSASAIAIEDCELLALTRKGFEELAKSHPTIGFELMKEIGASLAGRLRSTTRNFANINSK